MGLLVFVAGGLVLGFALARALGRLPGARLVRGGIVEPLDLACATLLLSLAAWIAASWVLAILGVLRAGSLVAAGGLELAIGAVLLVRAGGGRPGAPGIDRAALALSLVALAPIAAWLPYVLWRSALLPPYNHDALAYHFPKAVMLLGAKGYRFFDVPEARIATWPWNYELLVADVMALAGDDHLTGWIGTFTYVGFLLLSARMAAGWWGGGAHAAFVSAIAGTTPIAILHSGLQKNDLMAAMLALAAATWGARWAVAGCTAAAMLATLALVVAVGTKVGAVFLVLPAGVVLAVGAVRHRAIGVGRLVAFAASAMAASLVLGAWSYLANLAATGELVRPVELHSGLVGYGQWSNLWVLGSMLLVRPFGAMNHGWNPFAGAYWWWPRNDVWFSDLGAVVSVLALAAIPCVLRYRTWGEPGEREERRLGSFVLLAACALTFPLRAQPVGFFGIARYVVFVVPVLAAWTVSPVCVELERLRGRAAWAEGAIAIVLAALGARALYVFGIHDAYATIEYVGQQRENPANRIPLTRQDRAATLFDAMAGPDDVCAIDVGFDTWIYPAYGAHWTRDVRILPRTPAGAPVPIPPDAKWVIVDRSWNTFLNAPGFDDMGKAYLLMGQGRATDDDLRVYRQLLADPRFEVVYDERLRNQAIFRRR